MQLQNDKKSAAFERQNKILQYTPQLKLIKQNFLILLRVQRQDIKQHTVTTLTAIDR